MHYIIVIARVNGFADDFFGYKYTRHKVSKSLFSIVNIKINNTKKLTWMPVIKIMSMLTSSLGFQELNA